MPERLRRARNAGIGMTAHVDPVRRRYVAVAGVLGTVGVAVLVAAVRQRRSWREHGPDEILLDAAPQRATERLSGTVSLAPLRLGPELNWILTVRDRAGRRRTEGRAALTAGSTLARACGYAGGT